MNRYISKNVNDPNQYYFPRKDPTPWISISEDKDDRKLTIRERVVDVLLYAIVCILVGLFFWWGLK